MSFDDYMNTCKIHSVPVGRPQKIKEKRKNFKGRIWCAEDFPLVVDDLIRVLEPMVSQSILLARVYEILYFKLPPGFPVQFGLFSYASASSSLL